MFYADDAFYLLKFNNAGLGVLFKGRLVLIPETRLTAVLKP